MARQGPSHAVSRRHFLRLLGGLAAPFAIPGLANAGASDHAPQIKEGDTAGCERITLEDALTGPEVKYQVWYLPSECAEYNGKLYQVEPRSIWWHWDGGENPKTEDHNRVLVTWYTLVGRTRRHDPVATHFCVGPNSVLQMLPLSATMIVQGRLTDDRKIDDIRQAKSLGAIQIETTGRWYDQHPPLESQTATLVDLTAAAMQQYGITFPNILGHRERAAGNPKPDPGEYYLRQTRVKLLKALIARAEWRLIGHPDSWNFYREVLRGGKVVQVPNQTRERIWAHLTELERDLVLSYVVEPSGSDQVHWRCCPH